MAFYTYDSGEFKPKYLRSGRIRKHPPDLVIRVLQMIAAGQSHLEVAKIVGVNPVSAKNWYRMRFLPKTGQFSFKRVLPVIAKARTLYLATRSAPVTCLLNAVNSVGMSRSSWKVYLFAQALPTLPGYPLYADRLVNEKAERYGQGLRRYGAVMGVDHPDIRAEVEPPRSDSSRTAPVAKPPQIGRVFVRELQVTTPMPSRKYNLL